MKTVCVGSKVWIAVGLVVSALFVGRADARSLRAQIETIAGTDGIVIPSVGHVGHFTSSSASTLGLLVGQLAASAADFPAISTTPGFTYAYNPELKLFERSSASLGSIFIDRAETVGQGRFSVGFSYLYVDFDTLDGDDLKGLSFELEHQDTTDPTLGLPSPGNPDFENDTITLTFRQFSLRSHVYSFFGTYGITDKWDVNLLVPVVNTQLEATATGTLNITTSIPGTDDPFHDFGGGALSTTLGRVDDHSTGIGDILLRTKYRMLEGEWFNAASGLAVRLPTGDKDDFQGVGDTTVTPFFLASRNYKGHDFHTSLGLESNFEQFERSRVRYAAGVSVQILDQLAFLVDILGNSQINSDEVSTAIPVTDERNGNVIGTRQVSEDVRTDIVDLAVGLKINPYGTGIIFLSAITPLTTDGLRSDVIPVGGFEISF